MLNSASLRTLQNRMNPTIIFYEHGINSVPSSWRDWVNRAIAFTHLNTPHKAQTLFPSPTALTVFCRESERSKAFGKMLRWYSVNDWNIIIVGHSNGTRVTLEGMRLAGYPRIQALHLVCGACDANFETNGVNAALRKTSLQKVFVYAGGKDWAMKIENTLVGRTLFDITKPLGLRKDKQTIANRDFYFARNVSLTHAEQVAELEWPDYGHSDCWLQKNFDKTRAHFLSF